MHVYVHAGNSFRHSLRRIWEKSALGFGKVELGHRVRVWVYPWVHILAAQSEETRNVKPSLARVFKGCIHLSGQSRLNYGLKCVK